MLLFGMLVVVTDDAGAVANLLSVFLLTCLFLHSQSCNGVYFSVVCLYNHYTFLLETNEIYGRVPHQWTAKNLF